MGSIIVSLQFLKDYDNPEPATLITTLPQTTTSSVSPVLTTGTFYWKVRATNGASSTDSAVHSFTGAD